MTDAMPPEGAIIFENDEYLLRYAPPAPGVAAAGCTVVTFPNLEHPTGAGAAIWGGRYLTARGAAVIGVIPRRIGWYQAPGFFEAMAAARAYLGPRERIVTYGSSMGGYGAILGARRLAAERVVVSSPQFSIDPAVVPWDRRYRDHALRIGPFRHDIGAELSDTIRYHVLYDPSHRIDRDQVALFGQPARWQRLLLPGAGHLVPQTLIQTGATDALFDLLAGRGDAAALRRKVRAGRRQSRNYIRRMGNLCTDRAPAGRFTALFISLARTLGAPRLMRKWRAERSAARQRARQEAQTGAE